ncbi:MAG: uroporphyrinogen-III C-methyltransferase [Congregibacter sp.]
MSDKKDLGSGDETQDPAGGAEEMKRSAPDDAHAHDAGAVEATPAEPAPSGPSPVELARAAAAAAAPAPAVAQVDESPRSGANAIAWLALILVIVIAAGGFYFLMDLQRREGLLLQRVQGLEAVSGQDTTTFDQMRDNLQRKIELEIEGMQATQARAESDVQRAVARLETVATEAADKNRRDLERQLQTLQQTVDRQQESMRDQQQRINDLSVEDRDSWLLAEAQYLLRLANQRLIMTGDTASAEALLRSADNILRELGSADLHALRGALAADIAALRAVPKLDTQGLYLRLDALIRQTDALVMFELPERPSETATIDAEDWKARLAQGYELALAKLSEYVVVSRRDVPVETLMDPQYEGLVRQNMRMLLEQAQVAMLSGNERLFRQSLERAEGWVTQFFKSDEQAAQAMAAELASIRGERVAVNLPDLSASLSALDDVMQARLARKAN